jgi:hypothetical protein
MKEIIGQLGFLETVDLKRAHLVTQIHPNF